MQIEKEAILLFKDLKATMEPREKENRQKKTTSARNTITHLYTLQSLHKHCHCQSMLGDPIAYQQSYLTNANVTSSDLYLWRDYIFTTAPHPGSYMLY